MAPRSHAHRHEHPTVDVLKILKDSGLKVTRTRLALLELLAREHGPFTTDELYDRLSQHKSNGSCDVVTIYRCLAKFEDLGLIARCDFGDGTIRYEFQSHDLHHHHIICRKCKRIEPLPTCPVEDRPIKIPKMGFKEISHRLEFFGICPDCHCN